MPVDSLSRHVSSRFHLWIWSFLILSLFGVLYLLKGILLPFGVGFMIAYILNPLISKLETYGIHRFTSASVLVLTTFFGIIGFFLFTLPFLQSALMALAHRLPLYGERMYQVLSPVLEHYPSFLRLQDFLVLKEKLALYLGDILQWGLSTLVGILSNTLALANLISLLVLTPVVTFYVLRDWPKFTQGFLKLIPLKYKGTFLEQGQEINKTLGKYVRAQLLVCLCLSGIYGLGLFFTQLKYAWTLGIATGVLAFVPYVGFAIGAASGIGLALAQFHDWSSIGWVACVFLVGIALESYVLTPKLIGNGIGLHPVWIIFALLCGSLFFGFLGMFLAVPTAATVGVLVRFSLSKYFQSSFYTDTK